MVRRRRQTGRLGAAGAARPPPPAALTGSCCASWADADAAGAVGRGGGGASGVPCHGACGGGGGGACGGACASCRRCLLNGCSCGCGCARCSCSCCGAAAARGCGCGCGCSCCAAPAAACAAGAHGCCCCGYGSCCGCAAPCCRLGCGCVRAAGGHLPPPGCCPCSRAMRTESRRGEGCGRRWRYQQTVGGEGTRGRSAAVSEVWVVLYGTLRTRPFLQKCLHPLTVVAGGHQAPRAGSSRSLAAGQLAATVPAVHFLHGRRCRQEGKVLHCAVVLPLPPPAAPARTALWAAAQAGSRRVRGRRP